ncbi:helix-turn-helix domain-containing protein [Actinoplanes bogorensis]|uniref:Helix-turn-helix domain-containing protein n=1 Tax=Paractinoplanes bogorensis TaxID=1610840 RepID=A0ABS5YQ94_9ACTN|nr:helix-turn-helix domain-containing protein [Actinoplanes bogorensis]MBU2665241.1 helix-turn-helix domain-containing protein [Actinoplanes bogorensis]
MRTVFDSTGLAAPDRLAAWESVTAQSLIPTEIGSPEPLAFAARLGFVELGEAQVSAISYTSLSSRRSPRLIRAADPEHYQVALVRAGRQGIDQNRASALVGCGDFVIIDSSQQFEAVTAGTSESVILQFPKRLLPLPPAQIARLSAVSMPGGAGFGRLLAQFLTTLAEDHDDYTVRDTERLGRTAVDLTTAMLAHHLERDEPPLRSPSHLLYLRIVAFVDDNLHQPGLRPDAIAAVHGISLRYLHRIFQQHHHASVTAHIRARRLDRARRELIDPRFDHHTVASIAARCGFTRPSDFSRAFRRHTGVSPHHYRLNGRRPA